MCVCGMLEKGVMTRRTDDKVSHTHIKVRAHTQVWRWCGAGVALVFHTILRQSLSSPTFGYNLMIISPPPVIISAIISQSPSSTTWNSLR